MIVITGASDGLGLELAKLYKQANMKVINVSRRACGYADHDIIADLQKESDIQKAAETILQEKEPLAILVNCAGERVEDRSKWMRAEDLALLLKQLLDLPKLMEVSEIVIDRNKPSVLAKGQ